MIPKEVFEETLLQFLAPIRPFLDDASVSEIMINGPNRDLRRAQGEARADGRQLSEPRLARGGDA